MDRRTLLGLLGSSATVGVAGCTNLPGPPLRSTPTVEDGLQRRVAVAGQDPVPDEYGVRIRAELLDPSVTGTGTARVRVTTTNDGERRDLSVSTGKCALFNRESQGSDPAGLWLRRGGNPDDDGPRWVADDLPESPAGFGGYGCDARTYAAGESIGTDYAVLHDGRVDGYLPPGEYRFEKAVSVRPSDAETVDAVSFTWGFSLAVEDPE